MQKFRQNNSLTMHFLVPGGFQSWTESEELSYARNEGDLVSACFSAHSIFTKV